MNKSGVTKILIVLLFTFLALGIKEVYPLPEGEEVVEGTAAFDYSVPDTLMITTSETAIINFASFNIGENEYVYFYQPSSTSNVLNNVLGGGASYIAGFLYANGNIYIVNPAGIVFEPTANIDVGGLVASTMRISNDDFMSSKRVFYKLDEETGKIVNRGTINAADDSFIALLAETIENDGFIKADKSKVVLASGKKVTLSFEDDNLIQIVVDEAVDLNPLQLDCAIVNTGTVQADSGEIIIQASAVQGLFQNVVNNEGILVANRIAEEEDGTIALLAPGGNIRNTGTMYASGDITVEAQNGEILQVASADVKGANISFTASSDINLAGTITAQEGCKVDITSGGHIVTVSDITAKEGIIKFTSYDGIELGGKYDAGKTGHIYVTPIEGDTTIYETTVYSDTTWSDPGNITVAGDVTGLDGASLSFIADNDNSQETYGGGDFVQLTDTTIATYGGGDITIRSGSTALSGTGNVKVANVSSSGNLDVTAYGGEVSQIEDTTLAVVDGDLMIDAYSMTLYNIQAHTGHILIGNRRAPVQIAGLPHYIHTAGDIDITTVTSDASTTTLTTSHGDILRYATLGDLTLEAASGGVMNSSGIALPGDTIKLIGNQIGSIDTPFIVDANLTHIYRNIGDIDIAEVIDLEGDYVTIVGPAEGYGAVTYCSLASLTLEAPLGDVTDSGQAIVPANILTLIGSNIGHAGEPFITDANLTHVIRNQGDIVIALHSIYGLYASLRGPPEDGFGITYNTTKSLTLQARDGSIYTLEDTPVDANVLSLIASQNIGSSDQHFYFRATYLSTITAQNGSIYINSNNTDIYIRGDIYAYSDINIYSEEGVIDVRDKAGGTDITITSETGSINFEATTGHINVYGTISALEGTIRLWTSTHMDLAYSNLISEDGSFIWNPEDGITRIWDDGDAGDSNWDTAANWNPDGVPADTDDIIFRGSVTTNGCTINVATNVLNSFTIESDYDAGVITVSAIINTGDLVIQSNVADPATNTLVTGSNLNITGSITLSNKGAINQTAGTTTMSGQTVKTISNTGTGSITFAAFDERSDTSAGATYATTCSTDVIISGNFVINGGSQAGDGKFTLTGAKTLTIGGDFDNRGNFISDDASNKVVVAGNIDLQDSRAWGLSDAGTFEWNGTSIKHIYTKSTFNQINNFILSGSSKIDVIYTSTGPFLIGGNYSQTNGTFEFGEPNCVVTGTTTITSGTMNVWQTGTTFTGGITNGGTINFYAQYNSAGIKVGSGTTFANNGQVVIANTGGGTATLEGDGGQFTFTGTDINYSGKSITLANIDYQTTVNLGAGEKIVIGDGNCEFDAINVTSGTLDDSGNYNFIVGDNWSITNSGTFTPGTGTVTLSGTTKTIITSSSNNDDFYDLTVSGSYTLEDPLIVNRDLSISGTLDAKDTENNAMTVARHITITGTGTYNARGSTITITGNGNFDIDGTFNYHTSNVDLQGDGEIQANWPSFYDLTCAGVGKTTTLAGEGGGWNGINLLHTLTTALTGTLTGANKGIIIQNDGTVANSGTIDVTTLQFNLNGGASTGSMSGGDYGSTKIEIINGGTVTLGGSITDSGNWHVGYDSGINILDLDNHDITSSGYFYVGNDTNKVGQVSCGSGSISAGDLYIYAADDGGTKSSVDLGSGTHTFSGAVTVEASDGAEEAHLTLSSVTTSVGGSFTGSGTVTHNSGTLVMNGATTPVNLNIGTNDLYNLTINKTNAADTVNLNTNDLDVDGAFHLQAGTFDCNDLNQNFAGNFTLDNGTTYTKGGTLTFDGTTAATYEDSNATKQNIGAVAVTKTSGDAADNKLTLKTIAGNGMKVDTLTISANNTLDLASGGYTLEIANAGSTATVLTVNAGATLTPGTSTVKYSATNDLGNIDVATTTYNSLQFSGNETYVLTGHLINANAVTGSITIDLGATLDTTAANSYGITVAGNWSNPGTFVARSGTVTFNGTGASVISGSTTFFNFTSTTTGKAMQFDNTATQTVEGALTLTGTADDLITLRSDIDGQQWSLDNTGTNDVSYVDVMDSDASGGNEIDATTGCTDSDNNLNWTFVITTTTGTSARVRLQASEVLSYMFHSSESEEEERKRRLMRIRVTLLIDTSNLILKNPYDFSISPYIISSDI